MPETNKLLMKMMLRRTPLTREEWKEVLEMRCETLAPYLDRCTLLTLRDVAFTQTGMGGGPLTLSDVSPEILSDGITEEDLAVTGFWSALSLSSRQYAIVGYSRQRRWVRCDISEGRIGNYTRSFSVVDLGLTDPIALVSRYKVLSYDQLWHLLGHPVQEWRERAERRAASLRDLTEILRVQDLMLDGIPNR